ncbi:class II aldolase/adducin family protein [Phytohabitans flavus]|uniref:class II aldolase/adducin family protein n=1 Tax=Phytohabitans flavus TaxID=1076124 RepID=UPI00362FBDEA
MWVKGSGGDLGTLTPGGLAVLRLDRLRALVDVYPGSPGVASPEREDEMVAAFDYCLHGRGGAAPSIDTAMHGLVEAAHVDHLHPDAGIAFATAADGEALTKECFGDRVAWVPWRRPGFQLGLDIAAVKQANPRAIGVILGGHGITAWGGTSEECEANSLEIIRSAQAFIDERGRPEPFGPIVEGYQALPEAERHARAAALAPVIRGLASTDRRQVGHYTGSDVVLDFLARAEHPAWPRSARPAQTTSCAPRSARSSSTCRPPRPSTRRSTGSGSCTPSTGPSTPPTTRSTRRRTARRCAAPTRRSCWSPASACSRTAPTSRPPAWPASSTSTPST